jgi:hypothetical protein
VERKNAGQDVALIFVEKKQENIKIKELKVN